MNIGYALFSTTICFLCYGLVYMRLGFLPFVCALYKYDVISNGYRTSPFLVVSYYFNWCILWLLFVEDFVVRVSFLLALFELWVPLFSFICQFRSKIHLDKLVGCAKCISARTQHTNFHTDK